MNVLPAHLDPNLCKMSDKQILAQFIDSPTKTGSLNGDESKLKLDEPKDYKNATTTKKMLDQAKSISIGSEDGTATMPNTITKKF